MINGIYGAMSILFGMLIVPLWGQNGMSISIFEYPEPIVFSKQRHFRNGASTTLTLLVSTSSASNNNDNQFQRWDLSINAEGNLESDNHSIPISSLWVRAKGNSKFRSRGKVFLSTKYQTIGSSKSGSSYSNNFFIDIKFKAFKGEHFLKSAGEYSSYIYFTLTMD